MWRSAHAPAVPFRAALAALVLVAATRAEAGERILVLTPHVAEVLAAVGAGGDVVGVVQHTDEPASMRALPRVASARGVVLEAAMRLEPTLAIAYTAGLPGLSRLEKLGVRITVSHPRGVADALDEIERIGRLAGRPERARRLADGLRARLETLRAQRPLPPPRVYYEVAADPLISVGPGNFLDDVLREVGAFNVFAGAPVANPRVNIEAVLRAQPDVLILPGEPRQAAERARFWLRRFGAGAPPHLPVPPDLLHRPGPRLIDGLEILQTGLLELRAESPG